MSEQTAATIPKPRLLHASRLLNATVSWATVVLLVYAFVSTVFIGPGAASWLPAVFITAALLLWTQGPYWIFRRLPRRDASQLRQRIIAVGNLLVCLISAVVLVDRFLIRADPQSALTLLFLPLVQFIACGLFATADIAVTGYETPPAEHSRRFRVKIVTAAVTMTAAAGFLCWWIAQQSSNHRDWIPNLAQPPHAEIDGDRVTIHNVRNTEYRSPDDYTPRYETRKYDLNDIAGVDFIVVPFQELAAGAHTFLSFRFSGGEVVSISAEVRREVGEPFSPLRGALRQCELIYVIADERDVMLLRTMHRKDRVYLYAINAPPSKVREMFVSMLRRANGLRSQPEFYNTLTNNCTSNILRHFNHINEKKLPANLKVLLPGYSDRLVYDLGLMDDSVPFETLKSQSEITKRANRAATEEDFSTQIRE